MSSTSKPARRSPEDRTRLGQWLRALREQRGLTQREFAEKVGVDHYSVIAQLENGRGFIPADRHRIWANALQVEFGEFLRALASHHGEDMILSDAAPAA